MPQQGIVFDGQYFSIPGVYYGDSTTFYKSPPPATPPLVFIGYGWGPPPGVPQPYTNPQDLQKALRGSPAASFVPFLTAPSPSMNGAQRITFIDASQNTQATLALMDGNNDTVATLTSLLYGPPSNQLSLAIAPGSVAGLKATLNDGYTRTTFIGDNLTVPLMIAYSGTATGAVTYTMTQNGPSGQFSIISPVPGKSINVPLGEGTYDTVGLLNEYLNGTSVFYSQLLSATQGQLPSASLSPTPGAVALPLPGSGGLQWVNVNAYLQDIPFWINNLTGSLATATVSGVVDAVDSLPAIGAATFFSGARGVPPTNGDYANALTAALSTSAWTVFCDSNAPGVQALLAEHCLMAGQAPFSAWRRGFTGSSIGDTPDETMAAAIGLNEYQVNYVYPGIYRTNPMTNQPQLYGGLYAAAAAAAMATGNQIAQPLTNKPLTATGIEAANSGRPLDPSQISALQNSGVMVVIAPQQTGVPSIMSDVTTWQNDNNPANTSSQQVACRFWVAYSVVAGLQEYIGTIAAPLVEVAILNAVKAILNSLIFTGAASSGVLTSWDTTSLVLVFTSSNMLAAIQFKATLVSQNRYITVFDTIAPFDFTINLASAA